MSSNTVYLPRVQFMSSEYSLCPKSTVYVPREQFILLEHSLCPKGTVYILISKLYSLNTQFSSNL